MPFNKRKAFGQHFLRDTAITRLIAETALSECDRTHARALMEIGPGKGAITEPLLELMSGNRTGADPLQFFVCEKDRHFAAQARVNWNIRVEEEDFLELPDDRWLLVDGKPWESLVVVSNLPYSVGTAILTRLAQFPQVIPAMVLMFQAEVAQRVRAQPRTHAWGSLSVWIQNIWDVEKLVHVPPKAFIPPPKVDSEVVILRPRTTPRIQLPDEVSRVRWQKLLKTTFAHRRKMLRSSFPKSGPMRGALELSEVDDTKRAEELTWEDWSQLFLALQKVESAS